MDKLQLKIVDEISGWGFNADTLLEQLKGFKGDEIVIPINSYGGNVLNGLGAYNILVGRSEKKTAKIVAYAMSMGTVIACAADWVQMPENGYYMIHNPAGEAWGEAKDMDRYSQLLKDMKTDVVNIYHKKTKLPKAEIREMMDAETWLTARRAKKLGFVDELTKGVDIQASFDKNEFKNLPTNLQITNIDNKMDSKNWLNKIANIFNLGKSVETDEQAQEVLNKVSEYVEAVNETEKYVTDMVADKVSSFENSFDEKLKGFVAKNEFKKVTDENEELRQKVEALEAEAKEEVRAAANQSNRVGNEAPKSLPENKSGGYSPLARLEKLRSQNTNN